MEAPATETYDLVLQAVGRSPNGRKIGAEAIGLTVNERGFIVVNAQLQTAEPTIYAIGDVVGEGGGIPMGNRARAR